MLCYNHAMPFKCINSDDFYLFSAHLYLIVNPNSRLSLSIPFSLSLSILHISTYIFFYRLSIHLYYVYLFQPHFLYVSLFLIYPPVSIFISFLLTSISLSIQIHAILFQSRFLYFYLFFIYPPIFVSILCLSTSISLYLFVNPD